MNSSSSITTVTTGKRARSEIETTANNTNTPTPTNKGSSKGYKRIANNNTYLSSSTRPPQRKIDPNSKAKGLRHFSMKVMQKVQEKVQTTYNEVADELVDEFMKERMVEHANDKKNNNNKVAATSSSSSSSTTNSSNTNGNDNKKGGGEITTTLTSKRKKKDPSGYDEKNIRRRVYDALNVLMAMGIILKDRKDITWQGLPDVKHNATHELETLQRNRDILEQKIQEKREYLRELIEQHVCYRNLAHSNKYAEQRGNRSGGANNNMGSINAEECIPLPFIVVSSDQNTKIGVKGSSDWNDVMLDFSHPFEVNDDSEILKRIGYGKTNWSQLSSMLPAELLFYCQQHELLDHLVDEPPYQDPCDTNEAESQSLASSHYDHNNINATTSQGARRLQYLTQSIPREETMNGMGGYFPIYANPPKTPDKHQNNET